MDAKRATLQPVDMPRCYLCDHDLVADVTSGEGGLTLTFVCPIHGSRGVNEIFNPNRVAARS